MSRPIYGSRMLGTAGKLAGLRAGAGRPAVSDLRRATSTSIRSAGDGVPSQLVVVADAFQALQSARHSADYDANYDPVRAVTINHVQDAETALKAAYSLWRASTSPKPHRQAAHATYSGYLRLALLKSGGPKGR